jgi:hypothetical protein
MLALDNPVVVTAIIVVVVITLMMLLYKGDRKSLIKTAFYTTVGVGGVIFLHNKAERERFASKAQSSYDQIMLNTQPVGGAQVQPRLYDQGGALMAPPNAGVMQGGQPSINSLAQPQSPPVDTLPIQTI